MKVHNVITIICVLLAGSVTFQEGRSQMLAPPQAFDMSRLVTTAAEIKKQHPTTPDHVLEQDSELIRRTFPTITARYSAMGLTEEDAYWATLRAWKSARLESPLRAIPDQPMDEDSYLRLVTDDFGPKIVKWQIQNAKSEIKPYILNRDLMLINNSHDKIVADYGARGFNEAEARSISLAAWKDVRLTSELPPNQRMNQASFIAYVENTIGIVMFDSDPDEAEVFMGTTKIGTTSNEKTRRLLRTFEDGKRITVVFSKTGFDTTTRECIAKGRDTVDCKAQLNKKP